MTMGPDPVRKAEDLRAVAARAVTDSLRAAVSRSGAAERAARFEECVRSLEAEKAKMEVFRRELPISVHLVADVIEWLKDELAQHRRPAPELFSPAPAAAPKKKAAPEGGKMEEADDKRSWMSSAQLWSCGSRDDSTGNSNGVAGAKKPAHKVSNAFMPLNGLARPTDAMPVPDLSLSSPAIDAACPAAPSATSSAVTDAGAQRQQQAQQRKARRCWSPELHRRFVAALQRLGGAQAATPKQIRELMKVDGLTNDEVKSHLQKYRLHTRRASSDGGDQQAAMALWSAPEQQYTTSQHSTSQSGSPQGPLQLTVSSRAVSVTGGDSCDGDEEEEEDGKSESYSWEMHQGVTKSSNRIHLPLPILKAASISPPRARLELAAPLPSARGDGAAPSSSSPRPSATDPVSNGFMPLNGLARSTDAAEKPAAMPVPDLSLPSPAIDAACPAARRVTRSAVTGAGAQRQQQAQQRKARRCWSPELHRQFVAALQRLGGPQAATPKKIRELMKVDGLTIDEVKSHLQKYRLHTPRVSSDGGDQQAAMALWSAPEQQYTTSQHITSQSGSPQGPLQPTVSSRAVSVTGGDSCDGDEEEEEDGKSESYSGEMQQRATKSSSS
ncbi:hypothetical protein EJB05_00716 [Eragrostis curvula]|uniref:HTH myb-type domain-containing protein n=1 Tax=Eragrostis curvula TaxID=38414 RepID=A0A5J9WMF5_9POAL|nr:hypothetical protein EJB05_00716 [Eragrostis curvula]